MRGGDAPRAVGATPAGEVITFDPDQTFIHTALPFCGVRPQAFYGPIKPGPGRVGRSLVSSKHMGGTCQVELCAVRNHGGFILAHMQGHSSKWYSVASVAAVSCSVASFCPVYGAPFAAAALLFAQICS